MMEKKCPFCGAETRPGDNFCLNCGNRLLPATPSSPSLQAPPAYGESTIAAPDNWAESVPLAPVQSGGSWPDMGGATVVGTEVGAPAYQPEPAPTAQATIDRIEQPARFILCAETGEVLQEYPLDKLEITIGRAPNSDILLSKDKLTSRRHATVHYENGHYTLRDERSANGTFVNGQQLEEMVPRVLQEDDHVGIGEHELIFHTSVVDLPTMAVYGQPPAEETLRTKSDEMATVTSSTNDDQYGTKDIDFGAPAPTPPTNPEPAPAMANGSAPMSIPAPAPGVSAKSPAESAPAPEYVPETPVGIPPHLGDLDKTNRSPEPYTPASKTEGGVTLSSFSSLSQPSLPDITALTAALSTLDGQVASLQQQLSATQEAMHKHDSELAQTTNQLRAGLRSVCERMDNSIAAVARNREALAWAELQQLVEDVMNNPRDIEYVAKLAKKARDLNKIFQIHQSVLSSMAESNSLLRGLIGEDK